MTGGRMRGVVPAAILKLLSGEVRRGMVGAQGCVEEPCPAISVGRATPQSFEIEAFFDTFGNQTISPDLPSTFFK